MKKVKFIYNPASGDHSVPQNLDRIIDIYQSHGFELTPYRLNFDGGEGLLDGLDGNCHHILTAGGDGTINYIVNVLKKNDVDLPVAMLRTGTANDFATVLDIPSEITEACKAILDGEIREIDLGMANGDYFVNVFSTGLFTEISQRTPTLMKNTFGKLAYYFSSLGELPNFRKMSLRIESEGRTVFDGAALILFVFNGKTAGNLPIAYLSDLEDGLLDLILVRADKMVENIRAVFRYMRRGSGHYPKELLHVRSSDIKVWSVRDESTDVDGQPGPPLPVHITCRHRALKVLLPKNALHHP